MSARTRWIRDEWRRLRTEHPRLHGWSFRVSGRMTSVLGRCRYRAGEVVLARWHVENADREDVLDTLRHEVAHVLAGPGTGHGPAWRRACRKVGARPERCSDDVEHWREHAPAAKKGPKWRIRCRECRGVVAERKALQGRLRSACMEGARGYRSKCCRAGLMAERLR